MIVRNKMVHCIVPVRNKEPWYIESALVRNKEPWYIESALVRNKEPWYIESVLVRKKEPCYIESVEVELRLCRKNEGVFRKHCKPDVKTRFRKQQDKYRHILTGEKVVYLSHTRDRSSGNQRRSFKSINNIMHRYKPNTMSESDTPYDSHNYFLNYFQSKFHKIGSVYLWSSHRSYVNICITLATI